MSTPFNDIEHLQTFCKRHLNKQIHEYFRNLDKITEEQWEETFNKNNPEHLLRQFSLHKDNDTIQMTIFRWNLYFNQINPKPLNVSDYIVGIPMADYEESVKFKPQLYWYFDTHYTEVDKIETEWQANKTNPNYRKRSYPRIRLTHRLTQKYIDLYKLDSRFFDPMTSWELGKLAERIERYFMVGNDYYVFERGIYKASYWDKANGFRLTIPYDKDDDLVGFFRRFFDSLEHRPDYEKYLKLDGREFGSLNIEGDNPRGQYERDGSVKSQYVDYDYWLGEKQATERNRTTGNVYLKYVQLKVWGRDPIWVYSTKRGQGLNRT